MRAGCCLPLALLLLCATAASADYAAALTNLPVGLGNLLDQEQPQCLNVLSVCKAGCDEQLLKCKLHKPLAGVEAIDRFHQVVCYLLGLVVAALLADNLRIRRQLAGSAWQFYELEAHLRHCLQGVKDQAFNYAQKLEEHTPKQTERRQQRDVRSPTPDVNPQAGGGFTSSHACSAASTPPAPASESSAPNLALLLAEAPPAQDAGAGNMDQLPGGLTHKIASPGKSPAAYDKHNHHPAALGPHQHQQFSASRNPGPGISPTGRYSPSLSAGQRPVLPGASVTSPPAGYHGAHPVPGGAQRSPASGAPLAEWTPEQLQQQQQHQAVMSCPPMAGAAASPYGAGPIVPGAAPHSAGQLGGAMPAANAGQQGMLPPHPGTPPGAAVGGWVNTSRGSGTPLPFGSMGPNTGMQQQQQQPFPSPPMLAPGLCTPGTASTAQTAGSLTRVQSVHSTAGSCGGPMQRIGSTPGCHTPMSASSANSDGAGSSSASRSPAPNRSSRLREQQSMLLDNIDRLLSASKERTKLTKEAAAQQRAEQQPRPAGQLGASPVGSCADIRRSPV